MGQNDPAPRVSRERPLALLPNPFNPRTTVAFHVEAAGLVTLEVFDLRGRRVRVLQRGVLGVGAHEVVWEGEDTSGSAVASGVYLVRLQTATVEVHRRAVLIR